MRKGKFINQLKEIVSSKNEKRLFSLYDKILKAEEKGYVLTDEEDFLWTILLDRVSNETQQRGKKYEDDFYI